MQLGDLITKLAAKAGKDLPAEVKTILAEHGKTDIGKIEELVDSLMSEQDARNNAEVKKHFFAQFADAADVEFAKFKDLLGDSYAEIAKEKTFKKYEKIIEKFKEKLAEKDASTPDLKKYQDQINELNAKLTDLPKKFEKEKTELETGFRNQIIQRDLDVLLSGYKFNESIPEGYRLKLAREAVMDTLKEKGAVLTQVDGKLSLVQAQDQALKFNGELKAIMEKVFADQNLLQVSSPKPPAPAKTAAPAGSGTTVSDFFQKNLETLRAEAALNNK